MDTNINKRRSPRLHDLALTTVDSHGKIMEVHRKVLKRFLALARACSSAKNYKIRVTYAPGIVNEGSYSTKEQMLEVLMVFTAASEIDFLENYWKIKFRK